jgi:hypothetical protein
MKQEGHLRSFQLKPHNNLPKTILVSDFFSLSSTYTSKVSIGVHKPEYQPPVTSGSRVTGCTNFVN